MDDKQLIKTKIQELINEELNNYEQQMLDGNEDNSCSLLITQKLNILLNYINNLK